MLYEKTLEDIIYDSYHNDRQFLFDRGFPELNGLMLRQVDIGFNGRIDLAIIDVVKNQYEHKKVIRVNLFELKSGEINWDTLKQATRYKRGIVSYVHSMLPIYKKDYIMSVDVYLMGHSVSTDDGFDAMPNSRIFLYTYDFNAKGIHFNKEGFMVNFENHVLEMFSFTELKSIYGYYGGLD